MKISRLAFVVLAFAATTAHAAVKHDYDLQNVLWKLSFDMGKGTIAGDATNTLILTENTATVQLSCADLDVSKVTVNGKPAKFQTGDGALTVSLPQPGQAGQTLAIRALYTGAPVNGLYFVPASRAFPAKTGMIYTQGEGEDNHFWLPMYDSPEDKATTECYVTVPKTWTAISNGALLGVKTHGTTKVFHYKMDQPYSTYLISLVAGEFSKGHEEWHGIPVDYYVPPGLEAEGMLSFGDTPKMIDLYSKLTGVDYPYAKFAQDTVGDFMFGGMENVTCVTQTIRTLHPADTEPVNDSTYLVAHELAHHWFGDMITCATWEHMWLNEGFATTMPTFYDREIHGQDVFDLDRYSNFEGAIDTIGSRGRKAVSGEIGSVSGVTMGSPYAGGCSRILMLMHQLGESEFWKGIHAFLEEYKFKPATTDQFFAAMGKATGQDLSGYEKQWFHTAATPSLTASIDGTNLVIDQLEPYYTLDLPVWVLDGQDWVKKEIHVEGAQSRLDLGDLAGKPFLVDPECWSLMELKVNVTFTPPQVAALYAHAPNVAEKARIVAEMFDALPIEERIAIGHGETMPGLLQLIANHIGADGEGYLIFLARNQDQRVVNAAVLRLGALPEDPAASRVLGQIARSDPNEIVREHATQVLLNWSNDQGFAAKVWAMKAFDDGYRKMALDWMGNHEQDEARARCLAILAHPDSEPLRVTAIQVLGRVKGGKDVFDALVKVARETSYGARLAAIQSLAQLGDKDAINALKPITTHAPNAVMGTARSAIDQLSKS